MQFILHRKHDVEHNKLQVSNEIFQIQNIVVAMQKDIQMRVETPHSSSFFEHSNDSIKNKQISFEQSQSLLNQFKKQVEFTRSQLIEMVENDRFQNEAKIANRKGMDMIRDGQVSQAAILIGEAEKILQYAVSRGREIDRNLIISVLHNLACCHQQTWSLEKCSNYIQALIYNLNCEVKQIIDNENENRLIVIEEVIINRELAQYYLLFCAINSQLKRNDAALIAAKKGNSLLRNSSAALGRLASKSRIKIDISAIEVLGELGKLRTSTEDMNVEDLMEITGFYLYIWKNKCSFPNFQLRSLIQKLKDFSIGNVMQIQPRDIDIFEKSIWNELQLEKVLERVVITSMSYFTMATELRLLAIRLSNGDKDKAKDLSQFRESQCYHLISIILLIYYLPFDLLFLQHILTSYTYHYSVKLEPQFSKCDPKALFATLLENQYKEEIKGSTAMNSDKSPSSGPSRNSFQQAKSNLKLQSDVRASLKSQKYETNKEMAKLNNYYYMRDDKGIFQQSKKQPNLKSNRMSHHSGNKILLKRACATSKQSTQKTPVGYSPAQLSPKRTKNFSKGSKSGVSSKNGSINKRLSPAPNHAKRMSNIIDEYFTTGQETKHKKSKRKLTSKSKKSKQNIQFKGQSPSNPKLKDTILTSRPQASERRNKENNSQLKGLKSAGKLRSKLEQAKSKKKFSTIHNYQ